MKYFNIVCTRTNSTAIFSPPLSLFRVHQFLANIMNSPTLYPRKRGGPDVIMFITDFNTRIYQRVLKGDSEGGKRFSKEIRI